MCPWFAPGPLETVAHTVRKVCVYIYIALQHVAVCRNTFSCSTIRSEGLSITSSYFSVYPWCAPGPLETSAYTGRRVRAYMYLQYVTYTCTPILFWKPADYSWSLKHRNINQLSFGKELTIVGLFSRLVYEWVMSHMWMSHFTHMNVSCHVVRKELTIVDLFSRLVIKLKGEELPLLRLPLLPPPHYDHCLHENRAIAKESARCFVRMKSPVVCRESWERHQFQQNGPLLSGLQLKTFG